MDVELWSLIREQYPFPIAHAHKKTLAFLDDDAHKLKCLIQAAEATVQFLALVMLAQLHHDLAHQQAPALGQRGLQLRDDLRKSLVRQMARAPARPPEAIPRTASPAGDARAVRGLLPAGARLQTHPAARGAQAIEPLITLRNQFHHPGIPDALIPEKVAIGTYCLEQLLERLKFLHAYPLDFVQRIEVRHDGAAVRHFRHDLVQMQGCFSTFERQRWESDVHLREGRLVLLTSAATGRSLFLDPFFACAEELPVPGVFDIFLLNGTEQRRARFLSAQCRAGTEHRPPHLGPGCGVRGSPGPVLRPAAPGAHDGHRGGAGVSRPGAASRRGGACWRLDGGGVPGAVPACRRGQTSRQPV